MNTTAAVNATPELNKPEVQAIDAESRQLAAVAQGFKISNAAGYTAAGERLTQIKTARKHVEDTRTAITKPMNAALKAVNDFFREPATRLDNAERAIKQAMIAYDNEQRRIAEEQQRKLDEQSRRERERIEAQQRAEEERARARAAEERRKAEEKAAAERAEAERLQREADAALAAGLAAEAKRLEEERAQRDAAAKRALSDGEARVARIEERSADKVESLAERAATVSAPVVSRDVPRVAGVSSRKVWKFEVVDASKVNPAFQMPDEQKLRKTITALGRDAQDLVGPGVRIYEDTSLAARRA